MSNPKLERKPITKEIKYFFSIKEDRLEVQATVKETAKKVNANYKINKENIKPSVADKNQINFSNYDGNHYTIVYISQNADDTYGKLEVTYQVVSKDYTDIESENTTFAIDGFKAQDAAVALINSESKKVLLEYIKPGGRPNDVNISNLIECYSNESVYSPSQIKISGYDESKYEISSIIKYHFVKVGPRVSKQDGIPDRQRGDLNILVELKLKSNKKVSKKIPLRTTGSLFYGVADMDYDDLPEYIL